MIFILITDFCKSYCKAIFKLKPIPQTKTDILKPGHRQFRKKDSRSNMRAFSLKSKNSRAHVYTVEGEKTKNEQRFHTHRV